MRIEYLDHVLTSDIETGPSHKSSTPINQKIKLTEMKTEDNFGLSVCLITSKGNKYPAGIAVISYSDLQNLPKNQNKEFKLSKCLDQDAVIEVSIM